MFIRWAAAASGKRLFDLLQRPDIALGMSSRDGTLAASQERRLTHPNVRLSTRVLPLVPSAPALPLERFDLP
jgi:hypothetical protein